MKEHGQLFVKHVEVEVKKPLRILVLADLYI